MSKITTVRNTILTALAALYPNKTKIANPYEPLNNPEPFRRDGYGLKYDGSTPSETEFKSYAYSTNFTVVLTKEVIKTDGDNAVPLENATIALLEEMHTLRSDFYNVDQLGIESSIMQVDLGSDSGIQFIGTDKTNFIFIEVSFNFIIEETL